MRIAMWSGPRNLSTAMMYSFGNRADFAVWDEPFYAPYLASTGLDHPMKEQIIRAHETDPHQVASRCIDSIPHKKPHLYMKHMPHHMLPGFPLDWAKHCINIHLIRHPARVIASYEAKRESITLEDIGFRQQLAIYKKLGGIVIDSAAIRAEPENKLRRLCDMIGLAFDPAMLAWPAGPKHADGVWAKHWYDAVHRSQGFAPPETKLPDVGDHQHLLNAALPAYEEMAKHAV